MENFKKKFYRQCELGVGPQHREFQEEILQAMQVGVAPTQKLTESQLTIMCEMGIHNKSLVSFYHFRSTA
ncbi:nitrogen fixation protein NifR [Staphylococcus argenteus]|nr:nitrogen fixation protein NifR [Staphylococcus argenteus]KAA0802080.1 nitrogen fixation protein NifR [Staphylococcus argenteus]MZG24374.1 nitrogen fixation protein NifR [Staphylococcus argenteus]TKX89290.1 nitrogen fixation protein NifR [Staphylococcus argenteus]